MAAEAASEAAMVVEVSAAAEGMEADTEDVEVMVVVVVATVAVLLAADMNPTRPRTHPIPSRTLLLPVVSLATPSTFATFLGRLATRILSNSSLLLVRLSAPKSSMNPMVDPAELVSSSLRRLVMPKQQFVSLTTKCQVGTNTFAAKFTGYQYGGRPLGLTYVKYTNQSNGDAMEGTEHTGGLTQDQIM